jgi:hypothetical protein
MGYGLAGASLELSENDSMACTRKLAQGMEHSQDFHLVFISHLDFHLVFISHHEQERCRLRRRQQASTKILELMLALTTFLILKPAFKPHF